MKINKIQNTNFKSQLLDKYVAQSKTQTATEMKNQEKAPINIFNQFAYQIEPFRFYSINAPEFNIETVNLKNNSILYVDTNTPTKTAVAQFEIFTNDNIQMNNAARRILAIMLSNKADKYNESRLNNSAYKIELQNYVESGKRNISGNFYSSDSKFLEGLETQIDTMFNPDLSEENFKKAKEEIFENIAAFDGINSNSMDVLFDVERIEKEDYEKVTLEDVTRLYNKIISNSQLKIAISLPKELYDKEKQNIFSLIETKVPQMQKLQSLSTKYTKPFDKNYRFEKKASDHPVVEKVFAIDDTNTLKDSIKLRLLSGIIDKRLQQIVPDDTKDEIKSTFSDCPYNKYLELYAASSKSKTPADILEGYLNSAIDSMLQKPIVQQELNEAKKQTAAALEADYTNTNYRSITILENYSDGMISVNNANKALNDITLPEIQEMAKKTTVKLLSC